MLVLSLPLAVYTAVTSRLVGLWSTADTIKPWHCVVTYV